MPSDWNAADSPGSSFLDIWNGLYYADVYLRFIDSIPSTCSPEPCRSATKSMLITRIWTLAVSRTPIPQGSGPGLCFFLDRSLRKRGADRAVIPAADFPSVKGPSVCRYSKRRACCGKIRLPYKGGFKVISALSDPPFSRSLAMRRVLRLSPPGEFT